MDADRRTVLKTAGAAAGGTLFSTTGGAAGTATIDDALDTGAEAVQEALVVFRSTDDTDALDRFDLALGHEFEALPIAYVEAAGDRLAAIAGHRSVRHVEANRDLDYHNGHAQTATRAREVQDPTAYGYDGAGVHVAVVDSGIDAYHRDLTGNVAHNYQYVDPVDASGSALWQDVGVADSDDIGHGTHCSGSIAGTGAASDEAYEGMAPGADLTVYAAGAGLSILKAVSAYDHLLATHAPGESDTPVRLVSNSYGIASESDFNPAGSLETAMYEAFDAGVLSLVSAGNSGPATNTLNDYVKAPYVLGIGATHDGIDDEQNAVTEQTGPNPEPKDTSLRPTDFSSRGRARTYTGGEGANYDRGAALANVRDLQSYDRPKKSGTREQSFTAGPGLDAGTIAGAPGAGSSTFVEYDPSAGTVSIEATISWTPQGQDLDVYLHEGSEDGPVVGSAASLDNPEVIETTLDDETTYYFEVDPYAAVQVTGTVTIDEFPAGEDAPSGPYGIYRVGVTAPGNQVVSTQGASGLNATNAVYGGERTETGAQYVALSGTSMSCPVTAGVTALMYQAFATEQGRFPAPEEALRVMEGAARPAAEPHYTPANAGAGFVDAVRAIEFVSGDLFVPDDDDIKLAPTDDDPETLSAAGSREDDGRTFRGGATDHVTVTVSELSHEVDAARELLPDGWAVVGTGEGVTTNEAGDRVFIDAARVSEATAEGETATFDFFVEAPDASGPYTLGPTEVRADRTATNGFVPVSGTTSTEYVVGADTGASF